MLSRDIIYLCKQNNIIPIILFKLHKNVLCDNFNVDNNELMTVSEKVDRNFLHFF